MILIATIIFVLSVYLGFRYRNKFQYIAYAAVIHITIGHSLIGFIRDSYFSNLGITLSTLFINPLLNVVLGGVIFYLFDEIFFGIKHIKLKPKFIKLILPLLFLGLSLLLILKYHPGTFSFYYYNCLLPFLLFIYILKINISKKKLLKIFKLFIYISVVLSFYGIFEFIIKTNNFHEMLLNSGIDRKVYQSFSSRTPYRIFSLTGHPLGLALILLTAINLLLYFHKKDKSFYLSIIIISTGLVLTFSRSAIILMILSYFIFIFNYQKKFSRKLLLTITFCVILFLLLYSFHELIIKRFIEASSSSFARIMAINMARKISLKNNIFGIGFSQYKEMTWEKIRYVNSIEIPWIIQIIEYGLIISLLYWSLLLFSLKKMYSLKKNKWIKSILLIIIIIIPHLSIQNGLVMESFMSIYLWLFIGFGLSLSNKYEHMYETN